MHDPKAVLPQEQSVAETNSGVHLEKINNCHSSSNIHQEK